MKVINFKRHAINAQFSRLEKILNVYYNNRKLIDIIIVDISFCGGFFKNYWGTISISDMNSINN